MTALETKSAYLRISVVPQSYSSIIMTTDEVLDCGVALSVTGSYTGC